MVGLTPIRVKFILSSFIGLILLMGPTDKFIKPD